MNQFINQPNKKDWLRICVELMRVGFAYKYGDEESMDAFPLLVFHALSVADHACEKDNDDTTLIGKIAWLYSEVRRGFWLNGRYEEALECH
jgi:hypothetical protein